MKHQIPQKRVTLTPDNIYKWPDFQRLYDEGKVVFDKTGRLRYTHGAPVVDMILVRVNKEGKAIYKESVEEWFDPDSPAAEKFKWPE